MVTGILVCITCTDGSTKLVNVKYRNVKFYRTVLFQFNIEPSNMASRNNIKIISGALVCVDSNLRGDITIGAGTIIHPNVSIIAEAGPIVIGESCLIEEQTKIIHRLPLGQPEPETPPILRIGSQNVFEVDCTVEAPKIGDSNVFESKCYVGSKVSVTSGCIIGAGCRLTAEQTLKDNTIIYGEECHQRVGLDKPAPQTLQLETLSKVLPNYHHLRRPNKKNQ
ncbi:Dynactin 6 p27 subunit [Carabus blaptoides fortunei]